MPAFRIQAKTFVLTYPQATNIPDKEDLHNFLLNFFPSKLVTGKEYHEDGNQHFHAVIHFNERRDIRDAHYFDFMDHHPNIQSCRSIARAVAYATKDGDYINLGFDIAQEQEDVFTVVREEVNQSTNATEAITNTISRTGTRGLRMYHQIASYIERIMRPTAVHFPMRPYPEAFRIMDPYLLGVLTKFIADFSTGRGERGDRRSLWLTGDTRLGKTVLARSLGNHWYMGSGWNIENYDDEAEYGVLDDIPWETLKYNYKGLMGLQLDVVVTDKYKKKTTILGGRPVIIITNDLPEFSETEWRWLAGNVTFAPITTKLF